MIDLAGSKVSFIQLLKNDLIKIDPGLPHVHFALFHFVFWNYEDKQAVNMLIFATLIFDNHVAL